MRYCLNSLGIFVGAGLLDVELYASDGQLDVAAGCSRRIHGLISVLLSFFRSRGLGMKGDFMLHQLVCIHEPLVTAWLVALLWSLLALQLLRPFQDFRWRLIDNNIAVSWSYHFRELVISWSYHFRELISWSSFRRASFWLNL